MRKMGVGHQKSKRKAVVRQKLEGKREYRGCAEMYTRRRSPALS